MNIIDTFPEIESTSKPIARKLQQGRDFQILAQAYEHTTISIGGDNNKKVLMCQGSNLLLIGIYFKAGMILEKHITNLPARLVVLHGEVEYSNSHGSTHLAQHNQYLIPAEEPHWVTAIEDSLIVLIKNQPKQQYHEN